MPGGDTVLFHLISALLLLLSVATQYAWPEWLQLGGAAPLLSLAAVLSIGLVRGPSAGLVAGFFAAYLSASVGALGMGGQFITHIGIGLLAGFFRSGLFSTRITVAIIAALIATIATSLINLILAPPPEVFSWLRLTAMTSIVTALWTIPVFAVFRAIARRFSPDTGEY